LFGLVLVLVLAMLALPSFAAQSNNKTMSLVILTAVTDPTHTLQPGQVQATITNTSPSQSNSSFNSVDLFVDLNWAFGSITATASGVPVSPKNINPGNPKNTPPGHIRISGFTPVKPQQSVVITFSVTGGSGDGTFGANVWSGSSFSGNLFTQTAGTNIAPVPTASLACVVDPDAPPPPPPGAGSIIAMRGEWNKDGTASGDPCAAVPYYASNTLNNNVGLPQNVAHFRWDHSGNLPPPALPGTPDTFATAAFQYDIYYAAASAPDTRSGWLRQNGDLAVDPGANPNANNANPVVFIDTPLCIEPKQLPTPYGSLAANMDAVTTTLSFSSTGSHLSPPPVGLTDFPIYVGLERMQVKEINDDGTWTVERGQLGTSAVEHSIDAGAPLVMSTPLPSLGDTAPAAFLLNPNGTYSPATTNPYHANTQAQTCLVGSTSEGAPSSNQFIDIGDGWGVPR
jgi:hypothetical protein